MGKTRIIAVCGKGGVGKTSLSAVITKILIENKKLKILAIDADPAVGLATALGFHVQKTVDDIGNNLINNVGGIGKGNKKEIVLSLGYEVFGALEEKDNLAFLAIGRPEQEGCYCNVNGLLKDAIDPLTKDFDVVVIDGEAGIEQVNRRVLRSVTHLFLVSDASVKGMNVVRTIKQVADNAINFETAGLILNRIKNEEEKNKVSIPDSLSLWGMIQENDALRDMDRDGKTIFDVSIPPAEDTMRKILEDLSFF